MNAITLGIAWNRLLAIVEEQAQVLMRTAFSTVVREAGDLSAGIFDIQGRMLAQAVTGTPGHVNSMAESVNRFLEVHPVPGLRPGDVLLTNDPWDGTGHLNDFTVVTPVFHEGACVALFASTSHIADIGGRGFGADARDVHEEGLCIPVTHLFRAGVRDETLLRIIRANVRDPVVAEGDLYSLTACNDTGAAGLRRMLADFPGLSFVQLADHIVRTSNSAMRAEINRVAQGTWSADMMIDGYDQPLRLACTLTIADGTVRIDFAGSSGASPWGINVPIAYTTAYAAFAVRCVIGNHIPNNAGSLATIEVSAPDGSVLNARRPRSVSARHAVGQMLPDVVLGCLAQVIPERVPAEGASCIWNPVLMDAGESEGNTHVHRFVINPIFNGGTGARPGLDGLSATAFPSGVRSTSTEVNEVTSPLVIWRKELREGSGGAGRFTGGAGQVIEIAHIEGAPFRVSKMFDRIHHPARGRDGGGAGLAGRVYLKGGTMLRGKGTEIIPAGETLVLETPGGGGLGRSEARRSGE
jgi:N-methylhydantoinase B